MGLIPQTFIEELLARVDIVDVINSRVPLRKAGRNYMACCPFHQEKTPSFSVVPDKQFYNCFGCGAAGSALKFVMSFDNLTFKEAIEKLAAELGIEVPQEKTNNKTQSSYSVYYSLLKSTADFYQKNLASSQAAVNYINKRAIDVDIAKFFLLGFSQNNWDDLTKLFNNNSQYHDAGKPISKLLEAVGLWIEKTDDNGNPTGRGYDRFRNRLMFPIRDTKGNVIAFGGRVLDNGKPKYLNSPETTLFHKSAELYGLYESLTHHKQHRLNLTRFIIVEGYLDVIALFQHGLTSAVATLGTATSYRHLAKLFKYSQEVIYCFDGDEAGQNAAWRALENSLVALYPGRVIKFLFLPDGHDPDSFVREYGRERFLQEIDNAILLTDYLFKHQAESLNIQELKTVEDKVSFIKSCKPLINKVPDGDYKIILETELAAKCQLSQESIERILSSSGQSQTNVSASSNLGSSPGALPQRDSLSSTKQQPSLWRRACLMLLHNPEFALLISSELKQALAGLSHLKGAQLFVQICEGLTCAEAIYTIPEYLDYLSNLSAAQPENIAVKQLKNLVIKLLSLEPIVSGAKAKPEFVDLLGKLQGEIKALEMDSIKRKVTESGISSLTSIEREKLQSLLIG